MKDKLKSLPLDRKLLFTVQEVSVLTGLAPAFISQAIENGEIEITSFFGHKNPKISRQALLKWIKSNSYYKQQNIEVRL